MLYVSWLDMMELLWDGSSWQTRGSTGREIFVQASRRKIWQTFLFFIWLHGHIDISPRLIKVFWYDHMTMRNVRPVDPLAISGRVIEAWSAVSYRRRRHAFFFTVNVQKAKKSLLTENRLFDRDLWRDPNRKMLGRWMHTRFVDHVFNQPKLIIPVNKRKTKKLTITLDISVVDQMDSSIKWAENRWTYIECVDDHLYLCKS